MDSINSFPPDLISVFILQPLYTALLFLEDAEFKGEALILCRRRVSCSNEQAEGYPRPCTYFIPHVQQNFILYTLDGHGNQHPIFSFRILLPVS